MRHVWLGILILAPLASPPAWSQDRPTPTPREQSMRQQVERQFAERVRRELQLTDAQAARLRTTTEDYAKRREEFRGRGRALQDALADQLRPGVAANNDSVARLVDELTKLRMNYAESVRDELKDLSAFLTPVQRARFFIMRERLLRTARDMRERRMGERLERRRDSRPR